MDSKMRGCIVAFILLSFEFTWISTEISSKYETANAVCDMFPNHMKGNVEGRVVLSQKRNSKTGNYEPLQFDVNLRGLGRSGGLHGFHAHIKCDFSNRCESTGGHYDPNGKMTHGDRTDLIRHVGDFGNVECDEYGRIRTKFNDSMANIFSEDLNSILGVPLVVHAGEDDLGKGGNAASLLNGNSGPRLACCCVSPIGSK